jgi:hypothetical protein
MIYNNDGPIYSILSGGKPSCTGNVAFTWDGNPPDEYGFSTYVGNISGCSAACEVIPGVIYGGPYEGPTKSIPCCELDFPEASC